VSKQTRHKTRNKQKIGRKKNKPRKSGESQMERFADSNCCLFGRHRQHWQFVCCSHDVPNLDDLHAGSFWLNLFTFEWKINLWILCGIFTDVRRRSCKSRDFLSLKAFY
jgi:hypothetical protein